MKALRKVLQTGLVVAAVGLTMGAANAEDLLDKVTEAGELKVALEGTYPPFNYRNTKGELEGFDVDVAKAVAERLGVTPKFITTEWSGILAGLQAGKFDVIVNQVSMTPDRKKALDFSQPYVYSSPQLIQRANDKTDIAALTDFIGDKNLGVTLGTNYDQIARSVPGINVKTYPGPPEKLRDLVNGRIDATMDDRLLVPYLIETSKLPLRPGALIPGSDQEMGIPFRKGNPKFAKALDDALNAMRADGTLTNISMQWFGSDVTQPTQ